MKILDRKDAINSHQDERLIIVETAIHRVSCLNRTVLGVVEQRSISIIYRVGINGTRE
ncbi:hypothetical protein [Nostoc sp.]|uniref:hypothetical protein n=1 Tax=Nostoc sp. TaxID=1180 RepID=UPI002FF933D9